MENASVGRIELLLRNLCFEIKQKGREILADYELTPPQFNALQFLVDEGALTISELSGKLYLAPSTITDLIDRMEKSALVQRIRDSGDRRIVKVQVQERGYQVIQLVISRRCSCLKALMKDMKLEDMNQFIEYLEIMTMKSI
jgi:DNA-binding MarR family transcriptional regulator